ncbi:hypothetical protein DY000_02052371 [Brassica cretica]|uniref:SWIM-type domain-containing protein n=1 Tax=Brassica cretica TaxID=69181 RepID=A0ABQ7A966_BRACR|nr:hypothetical protein DY000_02052371 [Brassica cretica]
MLDEYFNDQEMMVIHRVHLEMEKAKLDLENQRCYELVHGNEIIVIDDTDSDGDGTEPLGSNKLSITVFNTDVALDSEYIPQPNVSNDSPMEYYEGIPLQFAVDEDLVIVQPSSPPIDDGISFWEGLQQNGTINVDHANSLTDSTPDLNEVNNVVLSWENVSDNLSNIQTMYDNPVVSEATVRLIPNPANADDNLVINLDDSSSEDSMDTTVRLIPNPANADDNLVINLDDSSSEDSMDSDRFQYLWRVYATKLKDSDVYEIRKLDPIHTCSVDDKSGYQSQVTHHVVGGMMKARFNGVTTNQHNELYVGMVFTNRNEFKLHMALYAISKKFRFCNIRSAPNGMVLRCFSSNCQWRVYTTKLKDSDVYEIRKLDPIHTCSVDDRSGYQSQVTHHVFGEMMKARFNAAIVAKIKVDSLVAEEYTKNAMVAAYVGSVAPVIDTDDIIELTGQLSELDMLCPSSRRPPGRPHKKPFLSCGQVRMKIPRRRTVCSHCKGFEVKKIKHLEYEVRNKEGYSFHVDISKRFCSCFEFQLLEITCQHAIAAAIVAKIKVDSLVAEEYTKNAMVAAYVGSVTPVINTDDIIELTGQLSELDVLPPTSRRPPGRPRKKRFLSRGKVRMKTTRRRTVYSRCKGCGHNRATCKTPIS